MKKRQTTRDLVALGFIAALGLATLFLITGMMQSTGNFVYAGGRVQLTTDEACASVTSCTQGPAVFVSTTGWKFRQLPGLYTLCICPEHVTAWNGQKPLTYDNAHLKIVPIVQNYEGGMYLGYD